jgi:adenylate cyclase
MIAPMLIRVHDQGKLAYAGEFDGVVELGRQIDPGEPVFTGKPDTGKGRGRVVVARIDEHTVSRRHAEVGLLPGGRLRVRNLSAVNTLSLADGTVLAPKEATEVACPAVLSIGRKTVRVEEGDADEGKALIHGLPNAMTAPGRSGFVPKLPALELPESGGVDVESVVGWLRAIMDVLQTAVSSSEFFQRAARGVVEVAGLDAGRVLVRDGVEWRTEATGRSEGAPEIATRRPSGRVLARLCGERRTLWQEPDLSEGSSFSLADARLVVAAPILDRDGEVIAALYGERFRSTWPAQAPRIPRVDALLLELLASGVAAGLARAEQERAAVEARVRFEQFFTPELAHELAARPDLLTGRDREVTLLFCDIRGFSRLSGRLGPAGTMRWIGDTLGEVSGCILAQGGVLVDYVGDEVLAMWGAPHDMPDHPRRACRAALDILDRLPALNARWAADLCEPFGVGIGINTGIAQVGNAGSVHKFKYGALGNTVNLASRVQGATRYLKTDILLTASTRDRLGPDFLTRRLGKVALMNITDPIELYELSPPGRPGWSELRDGYDRALTRFEARQFHEAARALGNLLADHPDDGPSLLLLSRTVGQLLQGPDDTHPILRLPGK